MKYWVFQGNQVTGPFEPDDLPQTPGYSGETLVCPEGRKGTSMGDWQRASNVPELSMSILKASQLAVAVKGGGYPALPPEPTLKDLAALGSLQEKVSLLDSTVSHLQESLRLKDEELLSVHKELEDKNRYAESLSVKLGGLEERLTAVNTLREGLDKAVAAEQDVEATVSRQAQMITDLKAQLEMLSAEQKKAEELRAEIAKLKEEQEAERAELRRQQSDYETKVAEAKAAAAAVGEKDLAEIERTRVELERKLAEASASRPAFSPAAAPASGGSPFDKSPLPMERTPLPPEPSPAPLGLSSTPAPLGLSPAPAPSPVPFAGAEPLSGFPSPLSPAPLPISPLPSSPLELTPLGAAPTPATSLEPLGVPSAGDVLAGASLPAASPILPPPVASAPAATAKPKGKSKAAGKLVIVALVVGGGLAAWKLGAPAKKAAPEKPIAAVAATPAPAMPNPEAELEDQKKKAIELVRAAAPALETTFPPALGGLSPWFADKIREGVFQVNFYPPKDGAKGAPQAFEFEASLADGAITPHNDAAAAVLAGKPIKAAASPAPKGRARGRGKVPIKPKPGSGMDDSGGVSLDNPLNLDENSGGDDAASAPKAAAPKAAKPAKGKAKAKKAPPPPKDQSLDELLEPGANDAAPAETDDAPKAPARKGKAAQKGQPADAELLDDLLKP